MLPRACMHARARFPEAWRRGFTPLNRTSSHCFTTLGSANRALLASSRCRTSPAGDGTRGSVVKRGPTPFETKRTGGLSFLAPEQRRHSARSASESSSRGASLPRLPGRSQGHPPDSAMIGPRAPFPHYRRPEMPPHRIVSSRARATEMSLRNEY